MLGSSVWIQTKSNLFWFIEGRTHFRSSWHAKTSSTLNEPTQNVLSSKSPHHLQACTKDLPNMKVLNHNKQLSTKTCVALENNFNVQHLKTFDSDTEALRVLWQGFAYLLFSANSAGIAMAQLLQSGNTYISGTHTCADASTFCTQARVAIALGFGAFLTLAISALLTGMRVARWMMSWRAHRPIY